MTQYADNKESLKQAPESVRARVDTLRGTIRVLSRTLNVDVLTEFDPNRFKPTNTPPVPESGSTENMKLVRVETGQPKSDDLAPQANSDVIVQDQQAVPTSDINPDTVRDNLARIYRGN